MNDILIWIVSTLVFALFGYSGFQKLRADKLEKEKNIAERNHNIAKIKVGIGEASDKIKDSLVKVKVENNDEKEEVIKQVLDVKEEEELSEEVKDLASEQSARANARADRLSERSTSN